MKSKLVEGVWSRRSVLALAGGLLGACGVRAGASEAVSSSNRDPVTAPIGWPQRVRASTAPLALVLGRNAITVINTIDIGVGLGQFPAPQGAPNAGTWWRWRAEFEATCVNRGSDPEAIQIFAAYSPYEPMAGAPVYPTQVEGAPWSVPRAADGTFSSGLTTTVPADGQQHQYHGRVWSVDILATGGFYPELRLIEAQIGAPPGSMQSYLKAGARDLPGLYLCGAGAAGQVQIVQLGMLATLEPCNPEMEGGNTNHGIVFT
ncbi:MAG TPA: hypothetical protein VKV05_10685 [Terriglobales bacterium]|nr:hypothetical protein [Terriglobales bacterium]